MGLCEKRVGPRTFSVPGFSGVKLRMSGAAVKSGVKRPKSLRPNVFVRECERILARAAKSGRRQREANVYACCINLSRAISYTLYRRRATARAWFALPPIASLALSPIRTMSIPAIAPDAPIAMSGTVRGACPHDCPDTCAMLVTVEDGRAVRVAGDPDHPFTNGFLCAKVNRYIERTYHPDRLTQPLRRVGPKGSGQFAPTSWDEALDRVTDNFLSVERELGPEAVWPYFYAGTMGLVMRDGIERLTHAKRYSRFHGTICVGIAWPGYVAGTGRLMGVDPREMAKSDCV